MHVDLDYIYDPNPVQQDKNIDALLDRVKAMGVSTVYLQAFADPKGTGEAEALYFPNRYMPMRADLFNRVAWSLDTRCDVKVYAWMPLLAFKLPDSNPVANKLVLAASRDGSRPR
jgi:biofilm PGA synthesis lipoprotein PgaB